MTHLSSFLVAIRAVAWAVALATAPALGAFAQTVHPAPEAVVPLAAGQVVPSASVRTVTGQAVDLADLVRDEGALLVFYRGGW